jgi:hypothetical protein
MHQFLLKQRVDDLKGQIVILTNSDATHDGIIEGFERHLIKNDAIKTGDPIIFFYAGHGNRVTVPEEWAVDRDCMTEIICPSDTDESEEKPGIPSRTMNALFGKLAASKGNNIVRHILSLRFYADEVRRADRHLR